MQQHVSNLFIYIMTFDLLISLWNREQNVILMNLKKWEKSGEN
jgi:uncharacterized membrane protein